jgi:sterol desaturase/sphingolipid hydroxylase (fatty acid hydroxylase superfamily)
MNKKILFSLSSALLLGFLFIKKKPKTVVVNKQKAVEIKPVVKKILPYFTLPIILGSGVSSTYYLVKKHNFKLMQAFSVSYFIVNGLLFLFQKIVPIRKEWNKSDKEELTDLKHTLLGSALGAGAGKLTSDIVFGSLRKIIKKDLWPAKLPFPAQIAIVFLTADLGRYVQHRLLHKYDFLWKHHALHHSVARMDVLKATRSHIIERYFQPIFMFGPLTLMGAPQKITNFYMIANSYLGLIDHANVDMRFGPFSYIFTGPYEHHIHHSLDQKEGNSNFGSALVVWDIIFGTHMAAGKKLRSPEILGIPDDTIPKDFWLQIKEPFKF